MRLSAAPPLIRGVVPLDVERKVFAEQRLTGHRLRKAA